MSSVGEYGLSYVEASKAENEKLAKLSKEAGGSWLMTLALLLGSVADKMMKEVMSLAKELDNIQDKKHDFTSNPANKGKEMPDYSENMITAKLQAQQQIMNMFMQAMNTVIKGMGEANKDVARKQ